jgi:SAM-dependent methyltransferase
MDSHALDFPDDRFDLIISRDFTWTFHDPVKVYSEWKRVLRPGGKILIFDANYGTLPSCTVCENRIKRMFFSNKRRPAWDIAAFSNLGMDVCAETELNNELSSENTHLLNETPPPFLIVAEKIHELETRKTERVIDFQEGYCKVTTIRWD